MIWKQFGIRDIKAKAFLIPFYKPSTGEGERQFDQLISRPDTTIGQYPKDYDLYYLGEYDDHDGKSTSLKTPELLVKGSELIKSILKDKTRPAKSGH